MQTSRRSFIKSSSLAILGAGFLSNEMLAAAKTKQLTGIQLYSVKEDMAKDAMGTLKQLAAMGYKNVEHANYVNRKFYGYSAVEFKKVLGDLGLNMPSGHTVLAKQHWDETKKDFTDAWKYTVEDAATVGQQFVISPWLDASLRKNADDLKKFMDVFNKSGELCKKHGMRFGYHNHDFEFKAQNGQMPYDIILNNTDPKLVKMEMDLFWTVKGKQDPLTYFNRFPGRFCLVHVKDMKQNGEMTEVGSGSIDFKKIFAQSERAGIQHYFVEHDQPKDPLESIKASYEYLRKLRY